MRLARRVSAVALLLLAGTAVPVLAPAAAAPGPPGVPVTSLPRGALLEVGKAPSPATSSYRDGNWANPDPVSVLATAGGGLEVVRSDEVADRLLVDELAPGSLQRVRSREVALTGWPLWGGLLGAPDGSRFVLVGRSNPDELDDRDVVQVRRYDRDWQLLGTAVVKGGVSQGIKGVYEPFDAGAPHLLLAGDRLVVHMSRTMYRSARDGLRHQANLTFEVDVRTMTATTFEQLGGTPYSSHSFQQLVALRGDELVLVDHGDAYPRSLQVSLVAGYPASRALVRHRFFPFAGQIGDNETGASVTDLVTGPGGVVVLGSSVRQQEGTAEELRARRAERRNLFAAHRAPDGATTVRWLTDFAPGGAEGAGEARAVPLGGDRTAVLFSVVGESTSRLEYRLVDSTGAVLASRSFPSVEHSTVSQPLLVGSTVHWGGIASRDGGLTWKTHLYGLDVTDPAAPVLDARAPRAFTTTPTPVVEGQVRVGSTLTARPGTWEPAPSLSYRWYAYGEPVPGADRATFVVPEHLQGSELAVEVTGTLSGHSTTSVSSAPTGPVAPRPRLDLVLDRQQVPFGTAVGLTLTGVPGSVVDVLSRRYPSTAFVKIREGVVLGSDGTARVAVRPDHNLRLTARDRTHDVSSEQPLLEVSSVTSLAAPVRAGTRRYVLSGSAAPYHQGKVVDLHRNGVRVARTSVTSSGGYRFDRVLPAGGATYQVRSPGTAWNLGSRSPSRYLFVR